MKHAAVLMTLDGTHKTVPLEDEVIQAFVARFRIHLLFYVAVDAHCFQRHFALLFVSKTFNLVSDAEQKFCKMIDSQKMNGQKRRAGLSDRE